MQCSEGYFSSYLSLRRVCKGNIIINNKILKRANYFDPSAKNGTKSAICRRSKVLYVLRSGGSWA